MRARTAIAVLIAAAAAAGPALAQLQTVFSLPPKERFAATDANKDGKVTKAEYQAILNPDAKPFIDNIFATLDRDTDGSLTEAEMNSMGGRARAGGGAAAAAAAGRGGRGPAAPAGQSAAQAAGGED